jgi:hypothetical protein
MDLLSQNLDLVNGIAPPAAAFRALLGCFMAKKSA